MIKKIALIFLLLIVFMGVVSAEDAGNTTVKNFDEVTDLISNANESDVISLDGHYVSDNANVEINKSITLDGGNGAVFDGNNKLMKFHIDSADVTFKNIKFTNICMSNNPIFVDTDYVDMSNCLIENTGNLNLVNCSFENIVSNILVYNAYNVNAYDVVNIDDCEFKDNFLRHSLFFSYSFDLNLNNSRIYNNKLNYILYGRGSGDENMIVTNNIFYNNTAGKHLFYCRCSGKDVVFTFTNNIILSNSNNYSKLYLYHYSDYHGDIVKFDKKIADNFWGRNIYGDSEFTLLDIAELEGVEYVWEKVIGWCNLKLEQLDNTTYKLYFINNKNQVVNMPDTTFSIVDKSNKTEIISNVKTGTFSSSEKISMDDDYILTITGSVVNKDPAKITYEIIGNNYYNIKIKVTLENDSKPLANQKIRFDIVFLDDMGYAWNTDYCICTDENGTAICDGTNGTPGYYRTPFLSPYNEYYNITTTFSSNDFSTRVSYNYLKIDDVPATINAKDITSTYNTQPTFMASVSSVECPLYSCFLSVYKGSKLIYSTRYYTKSSVLSIKLPKVDAGTYKIKVGIGGNYFKTKYKTVKWTVNKQKLTVKAPKVTNKFKQSKYFKATVKNAKNIKVKLKIYTGKKAKTYTVKTDKNGVAKWNTKGLSVGGHKVIISSGNSNYQFSANSKITIKR